MLVWKLEVHGRWVGDTGDKVTDTGRETYTPAAPSRGVSIRQFLRGSVPWAALERVAEELGDRYGFDPVHIRFLEAENWLSTPLVLNDQYFVKVVSPQNAVVHRLFTAGRNLGAFSSGTAGFFEAVDSPAAMAERELAATEQMRDIGVNVPEPVEAFGVDDLGVLVLEYLPAFSPLDELAVEEIGAWAPTVFEMLATMHANGLAHGDLRGENLLVSGGEVYVIDATSVEPDAIEGAKPYDIACALGAFAPHVGADAAVEAALSAYEIDDLLAAREFLDFVNIRPDHDFDAAEVKGTIETRAD